MPGTSIIVRPDGTVEDIPLTSGDSLSQMRHHIGCSFVDVVALTDKIDMWIDDDGIFTQKVNPAATLLARYYGFTYQPYYGPVILCSVTPEGDSVNLTADQVRGLLVTLLDAAGGD